MTTHKNRLFFFLIPVAVILSACQSIPASTPDLGSDPTILAPEPTVPPQIPSVEVASTPEGIRYVLPQRPGPRVVTSGTVPHVQLDVAPVPEVNDELYRLAFSLPGVENRPTIVSLPGARGMWIAEDVPLQHPEVIVSGREFAHIHPDGSLHLALPFERALEVAETGWGERHPWAEERDNWEGFVMLYTPQSMDELMVTFQLILESYNFVTGREITSADLDL